MDGLEILALGTVAISSIATFFAWLGSRSFDRKYKPTNTQPADQPADAETARGHNPSLRPYVFSKSHDTSGIVTGGLVRPEKKERSARPD